jgi:hypothetical protein
MHSRIYPKDKILVVSIALNKILNHSNNRIQIISHFLFILNLEFPLDSIPEIIYVHPNKVLRYLNVNSHFWPRFGIETRLPMILGVFGLATAFYTLVEKMASISPQRVWSAAKGVISPGSFKNVGQGALVPVQMGP